MGPRLDTLEATKAAMISAVPVVIDVNSCDLLSLVLSSPGGATQAYKVPQIASPIQD